MRDLNPKVATDSLGTSSFKCLFFMHSYIRKLELKSTCSRTNPSTSSASLKKIHLFFKKLSSRSFFILFCSLSFIFQISSFQIVPVVSGDPVLQNLELTVHVDVFL